MELIRQSEEMKTDHKVSYAEQCRVNGVAYSSLMRWKRRKNEGREPVQAPGPKKVVPLDRVDLLAKIEALRHGRRRTAGTGQLYGEWEKKISRRELSILVQEARRNAHRSQRDNLTRIHWRYPGLAWGMDDSQYNSYLCPERLHLHNVQDLGSTYKFTPLVDRHLADGDKVAKNLERLFDAHGAPLFLKRDNGSNLNHHAVDELLAERLVIPLNSPPYYPQYNGGIERAQRELKEWIGAQEPASLREAQLMAVPAASDLNHKRRPCLQGKTACVVFGGAAQLKFNRRKRREVYDWINNLMLCIIEANGGRLSVRSAWRLAVETWLRKYGGVTVNDQAEVLPNLIEKMAHN